MANLSKQVKGAIAEHYIVMRLLSRGYIASNTNLTVENSKSIDILCSNDNLKSFIAIQVKSSFDGGKSFNVGMVHGDFCTNGIFDDNKAMRSLEERIVCPWIFVNVDNTNDIPIFRTFILSREQTIKLIFESEKWYINDVHHANPLKPTGTVALVLGWLEGYDTSAITTGKRQRKHFSNPFNPGEFEEAWGNLGFD